MADSLIGDKTPEMQKYLPPGKPLLGGTDATSQVGYQYTGEAIVDEIVTSEQTPPPPPSSQSDKPSPRAPDPEKIREATLRKAIVKLQSNPWLKPSFLSGFTAVMYLIFNLQKDARYQDAQVGINVRQKLYALGESTAKLTRLITETQAEEKYIQAISSFVNAGLAVINLAETTKNVGTANKQITDEINAKKKELHDVKMKENPDLKVLDMPKRDPSKSQEDHMKEIDAWMKTKDKDFKYSPEVEKLEKQLQNMEESKQSNISRRETTLSQISQTRGEAAKQVVNAFSSFLQASITTDRAIAEEEKGLLEAAIQVLRTYEEKSTKSADEAKQEIDRFVDILTKMTDSTLQAHKMGRG